MDFGPADAAFWPIHLRRDANRQPIGPAFGFCPGKATWYSEVQNLFRLLILAAETGTLLYEGGVAEQPDWAADLMSWFIPDYLEMQFNRRALSIFGGGGKPDPATGPLKKK